MRELHDYAFKNVLNRDVFVEAWMNSNSFWFYDTGFDFFAPYVTTASWPTAPHRSGRVVAVVRVHLH